MPTDRRQRDHTHDLDGGLACVLVCVGWLIGWLADFLADFLATDAFRAFDLCFPALLAAVCVCVCVCMFVCTRQGSGQWDATDRYKENAWYWWMCVDGCVCHDDHDNG